MGVNGIDFAPSSFREFYFFAKGAKMTQANESQFVKAAKNFENQSGLTAMKKVNALKAGLAGALSLNVIHEYARHTIPNAPHVDQLAMRAVGLFVLKPLHREIPLKTLRRITMMGDIASNTLYYAFVVGAGSKTQNLWKRALLFGLGAGVATVVLPPLTRVGQQPSRNLPLTASLTVAWYTIGALVAAGLYTAVRRSPAHALSE